MQIKAVIFDMDGVIIDSEPLWRIAMIEVFRSVHLELTEDECAATQGLRIDEVVDFWYKQRPWKGNKARHEIVEAIILKVQQLIQEKGEAMKGFHQAVSLLRDNHLRLALASSSSKRLIITVINKVQANDDFEFLCSGEDEAYGKPHPAIFLKAASLLGLLPQECAVIEDSINGMVAAKAARMPCIVIPEYVNDEDPRWTLADVKLKSLEDLNMDIIQQLSANAIR
jgi:sugar-phosphatase